jgi:hypothetical protein
MLLTKLVVQENIFNKLSREANSNNKRANHKEGESNIEKMKSQTVEALGMLRLYLCPQIPQQ